MLDNTKKAYHIACSKGDVGRYCLLPGDPGRCEAIAEHFDDARLVAKNREFTTYTGYLCGEKVSVTSTGIGGPSAAIALEELALLGADTFIRTGTCGGMNVKVDGGDFVIATGAVRLDGTSREYAPIEYPAIADFDVTRAILSAAESMGTPYHAGIVQSKDSFYGQHNPERMPIAHELQTRWETWKRLGVLASEMEASTLMVCANSLGVRLGVCLLAVWNQERYSQNLPTKECHDTDGVIRLGVDALRLLIKNG